MSPENPPHIYATMIERLELGVVTHAIPVPPEIAESFISEGKRRVILGVNGNVLRRYLFRSTDGFLGVVVGKSVIRDLGLSTNEPFVVELQADPDPDAVDMGAELTAVLEADREAEKHFQALTRGRQRNVAYYVNTAKRSETRVKRALDMARRLRSGTLYGERRSPD